MVPAPRLLRASSPPPLWGRITCVQIRSRRICRTLLVRIFVNPTDNGRIQNERELKSGAGTKIRTRDLLITNQLLYQLSYTGIRAYQGLRFYVLRPANAMFSDMILSIAVAGHANGFNVRHSTE